MNKKGFEFSFGWIFAIVVGAVILFLGIYAAMNFVNGVRHSSDSFAGNAIGILLTPVSTQLESAKATTINFQVETRVYNDCKTYGNFGSQGISVATESSLGKQWVKSGAESTFYDKYIFSSSTIQGKSATVFVKPFKFPYKVADLFYLWSNNQSFCFVDAPDDIQSELSDLGVAGINFTSSANSCGKGRTKVCFTDIGLTGCDIEVNINSQSVKKDGQILYYTDDSDNSLLYGAIFSDPGIYECQVKRLMERTSALATIYTKKSQTLSPKGCSSNLEGDLINFANETLQLNQTIQLRSMQIDSENIGRTNNALSCKLF